MLTSLAIIGPLWIYYITLIQSPYYFSSISIILAENIDPKLQKVLYRERTILYKIKNGSPAPYYYDIVPNTITFSICKLLSDRPN